MTGVAMRYLLDPEAKTVHTKAGLTVFCDVLLSKAAQAGDTKVRGLLKDGWSRCNRCFTSR